MEEYKDYFVEKYGDTVAAGVTYKNNLYGVKITLPTSVWIQYDPIWFAENGIKSPGEYYLEGTWNYENYFKVVREVTQDTDGDGKNDVVAAGNDPAMFAYPLLVIDPDSTIIEHTLNKDATMEFLQSMYEAWNIDGSIIPGYYAAPGVNADGVYVAMPFVHTQAYDLWAINNLALVPIPYYETEEDAFLTDTGYIAIVPRGVQNKEASVSLVDHIKECTSDLMEIDSVFPEDNWADPWYSDLGKQFVADWTAQAEEFYAKKPELIAQTPILEKLWEKNSQYVRNVKTITFLGKVGSASGYFTNYLDQPAATALAEMIPVFDSQVNGWNATYARVK